MARKSCYPSLKVAKDGRRMSQKSLDNLEKNKYPKGVSGNQGSGTGYSVTSEVKHLLRNASTRKGIAKAMIDESTSGSVPMIRELLDRTEGKVAGDTPSVNNVAVIFVIGKGYKDLPQLKGSKKASERNTTQMTGKRLQNKPQQATGQGENGDDYT